MRGMLVSLAVVVALGVCAALFFILRAAALSGEAGLAARTEVGELREKLLELEGRERSLASEVEELSSKLRSAKSARARPSAKEIEEAVARWLEAHPPGAGPAEEARLETAAARAEAGAPLDLPSTLERLFQPGTSQAAKQEVWAKVRKAGLLDEALAILEKRAGENPALAECQAELGSAYIQKVQQAGSDVEKGTLAMKADRAFDAALALDENHWGARFQKATALAFWPPIFGKKAEAISQFEVLLQKQEAVPPRPEFAQSYLFLGNLYLEQGKREEALAAWKKGLGAFPDHAELARKLQSAEAK